MHIALSLMASALTKHVAIIRTERGLTIEGTRTSLYDVIDLLNAQYPPKLIRDTLNLTEVQMNVALSYIQTHQQQVDVEYKEVLETRKEIYQYWEHHNQERLAKIATTPRKPEHAAIWAKLDAQKAQRQAKHG